MYLPILPISISIRIFLYSSPLLRLARVGPDAHTLPGFGKELAPQSVEKAKVRLTGVPDFQYYMYLLIYFSACSSR